MLEIYQRETVDLQVSVYDEDGELADLSGFVITWRLAPILEPYIMEKQAVLVSPGVIRIQLNTDDTDQPRGDYLHEIRALYPDGSVQVLLQGEIVIFRSLFRND